MVVMTSASILLVGQLLSSSCSYESTCGGHRRVELEESLRPSAGRGDRSPPARAGRDLRRSARRAKQASMIVDVAASLSWLPGALADILQHAPAEACRLSRGRRVRPHLDPRPRRLGPRAARERRCPPRASTEVHSRIPVGGSKIGVVAAEQKACTSGRLCSDLTRGVADPAWARREGVGVPSRGIPLLVDDRIVGVMAIFARRPAQGPRLAAGRARGTRQDRRASASRRLRAEEPPCHARARRSLADSSTGSILRSSLDGHAEQPSRKYVNDVAMTGLPSGQTFRRDDQRRRLERDVPCTPPTICLRVAASSNLLW